MSLVLPSPCYLRDWERRQEFLSLPRKKWLKHLRRARRAFMVKYLTGNS